MFSFLRTLSKVGLILNSYVDISKIAKFLVGMDTSYSPFTYRFHTILIRVLGSNVVTVMIIDTVNIIYHHICVYDHAVTLV